MSQQGSSPTDLLNSAGGAGGSGTASTGSQAQFGIYLQLIQRIVASLEGGSTSNTNPFTVYPVTSSYAITIASAYPGVSAGTFIVRNTVPGATTVNLPSSGGPWLVADGAGNAGTYPITVNAPGGFTINGAASYILAFNWQEAAFLLDIAGANYIVGM